MIVTVLAVVVLVLGVFALENYGDFERTTLDVPSVLMSSVGLVCLLYGLSSFSLVQPCRPGGVDRGRCGGAGAVRPSSDEARQPHAAGGRVGDRAIPHRRHLHRDAEAPCLSAFRRPCRYSSRTCAAIPPPSAALSAPPGALLGAVMSMFAGRIFDKRGVRGVVVGGSLVMWCAVCLFLLPAARGRAVRRQGARTPCSPWACRRL